MTFKNYIILFIALSFFNVNSQNNDLILFTIADEPVFTSEFLRVYSKNLDIVTDENQKDIKNYLDLFINYKLKIKQAYDLKFDTIKSYQSELASYKKQLMDPYLRDESVLNDVVKEAYDRSLIEINASHILINENFKNPLDTLASYSKIIEARNKIIGGESFAEVAKKYSQDPSVQKNGGNLGYFSAFNMVYPFESSAYNTPINAVSIPFKTRFGYHILQVHDKRDARGEVEAAHIMIKGDSEVSKIKIDEIYSKLVRGEGFDNLAKTLSEDTYTAKKNGSLGRFGSGRMVKEFEDTAFALTNAGDFSKPFKSRFGWHIIKLVNKFPIESFDKIEDKITEKVKKGDRSKSIDYSIVHKLKTVYDIEINDRSLKAFKKENWKDNKRKFIKNLMIIDGEKINQKALFDYLNGNDLTEKALNSFKEVKILEHFKNDLENNNQEYKNTYQEYKEGLLLFEVLQSRIWEKSKDSLGVQNYYDANANNYLLVDGETPQELKKIRGKVINDYQEFLELEWIKELHSLYAVKMNEETVKSIIEK
ncbi:MAG: peptidylprolyl isomerase [Lutibacter sp.]|nr:MAG: peptidylprolyl isomerase [Lutibacter sp.]